MEDTEKMWEPDPDDDDDDLGYASDTENWEEGEEGEEPKEEEHSYPLSDRPGQNELNRFGHFITALRRFLEKENQKKEKDDEGFADINEKFMLEIHRYIRSELIIFLGEEDDDEEDAEEVEFDEGFFDDSDVDVDEFIRLNIELFGSMLSLHSNQSKEFVIEFSEGSPFVKDKEEEEKGLDGCEDRHQWLKQIRNFSRALNVFRNLKLSRRRHGGTTLRRVRQLNPNQNVGRGLAQGRSRRLPLSSPLWSSLRGLSSKSGQRKTEKEEEKKEEKEKKEEEKKEEEEEEENGFFGHFDTTGHHGLDNGGPSTALRGCRERKKKEEEETKKEEEKEKKEKKEGGKKMEKKKEEEGSNRHSDSHGHHGLDNGGPSTALRGCRERKKKEEEEEGSNRHSDSHGEFMLRIAVFCVQVINYLFGSSKNMKDEEKKKKEKEKKGEEGGFARASDTNGDHGLDNGGPSTAPRRFREGKEEEREEEDEGFFSGSLADIRGKRS